MTYCQHFKNGMEIVRKNLSGISLSILISFHIGPEIYKKGNFLLFSLWGSIADIIVLSPKR